MDLVEHVLPRAKQTQDDRKRERRELENWLDAWREDFRALVQVEAEMASALDRLQDATRALRVKPAAEILNPLQNQVWELSR
jgi:hypothetical protein